MEFNIDVGVNLAPLTAMVERMESTIQSGESNTARAVRAAGDFLVAEWVRTADARLKRSTGGYRNAIHNGVQYPYADDPLHFYVENKHPAVIILEEGAPAFDMKRALYTSPKVKISKKGRRYLIIPFQHGTPGEKGEERRTLQTMPQDIYEMAQKLNPTRKMLSGKTAWGGHLTRKDVDFGVGGLGRRTKVYTFGSGFGMGGRPNEVENPQYAGANARGGYTWRHSPYEGMYRMKTNRGSTYMTFRIMGEGSNGWIHPMQPALHIARDAVATSKPLIQQLIADGVKADLQMILPGIQQ